MHLWYKLETSLIYLDNVWRAPELSLIDYTLEMLWLLLSWFNVDIQEIPVLSQKAGISNTSGSKG